MVTRREGRPLVVVVGATASGKSGLAVRLAEEFGGEVVSCDSVAVYRGMDVGTAKPSREERARVRHHMIDVVGPDVGLTAGDYSREARAVLGTIGLGVVAGGTGLYLRALLEGLFAAPEARPELRTKLRGWEAGRLHRVLARLDPVAARNIHPHDQPKLVRGVEVSLAGRRPMTAMWGAGRDALAGFRVLKLGLRPERAALYRRIDARAAGMFAAGLVEETRGLLERYGPRRAFESLGYREAGAVVRGEMTVEEAVRRAQQGHRNYAKRQGTWFRGDEEIIWMDGFGEEAGVVEEAVERVRGHLGGGAG